MTDSENKMFEMLEGIFSTKNLAHYVVDLEYYMADETDQLDIDNRELADYLQEEVPEMTGLVFGEVPKKEFLQRMRVIIDNAYKLKSN